MIHNRFRLFALGLLIAVVLLGSSLACQAATFPGRQEPATITPAPTPAPTPTPLPAIPVLPGESHPEEPVFIRGEIIYTSPFFLNTVSEGFIMLEDQGGFIQRDRDFHFARAGQALGPIEIAGDQTLRYTLALPAVPQGTQHDLDHDGEAEAGVQVFALAYWSNTWGDPFLETRDGRAWSNAYASTLTDPEREDEITGGTLIIWAPDGEQDFPSGFGADEKLFTEDDPTAPLAAGYSLVDLDQEPFRVYKEAEPRIDLIEGEVAVNDYSSLDYAQAFEALFEKASREYPFTSEKNIAWEELYAEYAPRMARARDDNDFYRALQEFTFQIPDSHVGLSLNPEVFAEDYGGGLGLVLAELSDGRVLVRQVLPGLPADREGIQVGAEIFTWEDQPVSEALEAVVPGFGPYSTSQQRRLEQLVFLTRVPPNARLSLSFQNPGEDRPSEATPRAAFEYASLFAAIPTFQGDELALPLQGEILDESGLGYVRIDTFSDDYSLMARLWDRYLNTLIEDEVPGLIIDLRTNGGGNSELARDFAGYFFDHEIELYQGYYYNELSGEFEPSGRKARIEPAPLLYEGPIAVLVSPYCASACEGFAYGLTQEGRASVIGHYPSAGAFGEVGRGQYKLPGDISAQFPTGRPLTSQGDLLLEGRGVRLDLEVPVTEASLLSPEDAVLQAGIDFLLAEIEN